MKIFIQFINKDFESQTLNSKKLLSEARKYKDNTDKQKQKK